MYLLIHRKTRSVYGFPFFFENSTILSTLTLDNISGDNMKKYIMTFALALVIGLVIGRFILNQYTFEGKIVSTFNKQEKAYFIQQGVYSSKENMESATSSLPYYIYSVEDNKYYVYAGISLNLENVDKIKGYYESLGYTTYVKEIFINNNDFITVLTQYDLLLKETKDKQVIGTICSQVLTKYEELVLKNVN